MFLKSRPGLHWILIAVMGLLMAGIYLHSDSFKQFLAVGLLIVGLHIFFAVVIVLVGGKFLKKMHGKFHGTAAHDQLDSRPETRGLTINWAGIYDILVKVILLGGENKFRSAIVRLAELKAGEKVIDVGCGTGTLAISAKLSDGSNSELYGIDASPEMIHRARIKAKAAGVEIEFKTLPAENTGFPDGSFDVIMNSMFVHHLPGDLKQSVFSEFHRLLKPGGRLLIVDFKPSGSKLFKGILGLLLGRDMMKIKNQAMIPLLAKTGFEIDDTGKAGISLVQFVKAHKI